MNQHQTLPRSLGFYAIIDPLLYKVSQGGKSLSKESVGGTTRCNHLWLMLINKNRNHSGATEISRQSYNH